MKVTACLAAVLSLAAAGAEAVSISEYYGKDCSGTVNVFISSSIPTKCNTQQGASIGYTLDKSCSLTFYSDNDCKSAAKTIPAATKGCEDFPATGGSWLFHC